MKAHFFKKAASMFVLSLITASTPVFALYPKAYGEFQTDTPFYLSFPAVFKKHVANLKNLDKKNPKLLIMFSAMSGLGKSNIASEIEKQFEAIRLNHEEVVKLLYEAGVDPKWSDEYLEYCLHELKKISTNRMIVIDKVSLKKYTEYRRFAKENSYPTYLVRIVSPKQFLQKNLKKKLPKKEVAKNGIELLDYMKLASMHLIDYTFDIDKPFTAEVQLLADSLRNQFFARTSTEDDEGCMKKFQPGSLPYIKMRQQILAAQYHPVQAPIISDRTKVSEIIPGLFLGSQKGCQHITSLEKVKKQRNISHILTCRKDPIRPTVSTFAWKGASIDDIPQEQIFHFFDQAYDFIDGAKNGVFVHCKQGVSRSASIVIAYLMKKFNVHYEAALNYVMSKRPFIDPNVGFREQLKEYDAYLQAKLLVSREKIYVPQKSKSRKAKKREARRTQIQRAEQELKHSQKQKASHIHTQKFQNRPPVENPVPQVKKKKKAHVKPVKTPAKIPPKVPVRVKRGGNEMPSLRQPLPARQGRR